MSGHSAENGLRPRCPGCAHSCCPHPGLECGGESDKVRACAEKDARGIDLRYCSATWLGSRCDLRYDHDGLHHDRMHDVSWPRVFPPGEGKP